MVVQLPPEQERPPPSGEPDDARVEAGVIDEARARHRRERWGGAVVAALAIIAGLLFGLGGGGGGSTSAGRHHGGRPPSASRHARPQLSVTATRIGSALSFGLVAPGAGWVATASALYLTHDGGLHWRLLGRSGSRTSSAHLAISGIAPGRPLAEDLGGSSSPSPNVLAMSFASRRHPARACRLPAAVPAGVLALSRDAGRTWSTHFLPGCQLQSYSFASASVGYAVSTGDTHDSGLYRTDDGGARWHLVSRFPAPMTVSFGSPSDGLAFVTPNTHSAAAVLYRTSDGGRSWRRLSICGDTRDPTFTVYCGPPVSFGRAGVVLAIAQDLSKGYGYHAYLYTTADAGRRWTRHAVPPLGSPEMPAFSAPNARDIFVYSMNGVLHTTTDGGRTWSSIAAPQFRALEQMQFISARYGWLLSPHGLDYSTDGGRSWRPLESRRHG